MFLADRITELCQILAAAFHISILVLAVQRRSANDNVVMHMMFVNVCRNDVGKLVVGHPGRQLLSDFVCFLRRDLFGFESLPDMIADHFVFLRASCVCLVFLAEKHELIRRSFGRAGVSRNQNSAVRLFRIHDVIQPFSNTLPGSFPFVDVNGHDSCGCHGYSFQC